LVSQFEYILRLKCRYLNQEGQIIRTIPKQLVKKAGLNKKKKDTKGRIIPSKPPKKQERINQINKVFILYTYKNTSHIAKRLAQLEKDLSLSKRLEFRHLGAHGLWPDISVEGWLYGLIIAMFYYNAN